MSRMPSVYIPHGGGPSFFMTGSVNNATSKLKISYVRFIHTCQQDPMRF